MYMSLGEAVFISKEAERGVSMRQSTATVTMALDWFRERVGEPSDVIVSLPDDKNLDGLAQALAGLKILRVTLNDREHLRFSSFNIGREIGVSDLDAIPLGRRVLAVGTISFIAEMLAYLDARTDKPGNRGLSRG
jgi:hypothetical protein